MLKKILNFVFKSNKKTSHTHNTEEKVVTRTNGFTPSPKVEPVAMPSTAYFSPSDACLSAIIFQLKAATKTVDVCVFTISDDRISREIIACHKRNIKVRIISDNEKMNDEGSDIFTLSKEGIPVKVDTSTGHMHHKFAIIDGKVLVNGSYNWTRSAAQYNYENIVVSKEIALIEQFQKEFSKIWGNLSFYK
jgi:phosphatidylserine/phosphatidylglycerophosphate/cardiolipin synthase-like enzyme